MNVMILVPKVVQGFISQFPETTNNAYKYFNYDHRVVNERAETRFDHQAQYKGPEDLTDQDYSTIVSYAKSLVNPILAKYSPHVACEDALHLAIRSYDRGIYDGKINASKYSVLLNAMERIPQGPVSLPLPVMAKKDKKAPEDKKVPEVSQSTMRNVLKRLNIDKVPSRSKSIKKQLLAPSFVKVPGKGIKVVQGK